MPFLGFLGNFHHSWKLQPEPDVGFMQLGGFDVTILLIKFHILSLRLLVFFLWPHIAITAQTSGVWVRRHVCILRVLYVKGCCGCQESYSLFALTNRMCYFPEGNQFPLQQCKYSESSEQHAEGLCRQCDVRRTQPSGSLCWQAAYSCQRMATLEAAGLPRMCVGLLCKAQNSELWVSRSFFPF